MTTGERPFVAFSVPLRGANIINASAGTGKTYAITSLVVRLLVEARLPIERILVVTFTEAATSELRGRVRSRLRAACEAFRCAAFEPSASSGDAELDTYARERKARDAAGFGADHDALLTALSDVDQAAIFTIHGFCFRVLQHAAFATGMPFDCEVAQRDSAQLAQVADDFWAQLLDSSSRLETEEVLLVGGLRDQVRDLIAQAMSNPDMRVVPDVPLETSPRPIPDIQLLYAQLRDVYDVERVGEVLADSPHIRGRRPSPAERRKRLASVSRYLEPQSQVGGKVHGRGTTKTLAHLLPSALGATAEDLEHPFFARLEAYLEGMSQRDTARDAFRVAVKQRALEFARNVSRTTPNHRERLSFDGLLLALRDALVGAEGPRLVQVMRQQYGAALIDEFQDTDPVQFQIFHRVYHGSDLPLFMIGDPKQAIYAFRGADVFAYLRALKDTEGTRHSMGVNWRSDPSLVDAVNRLFTDLPDGLRSFVIEGIDYAQVAARPDATDQFLSDGNFANEPFEILFCNRPTARDAPLPAAALISDVGSLVAEDIARLLNSDCKIGQQAIEPQHIAVLARTNQQCFDIQAELRKRRVPAVVLGDRNVFETDEAAELTWVLQAVLEPTSGHRLRRALTTGIVGLGANELEELAHNAEGWERWVELFRQLHADWALRGFVQMTRTLLARTTLVGQLLSRVDGERRVTNLLHLFELLHVASRNTHLGPAGLVHWLTQERANAAQKSGQTAEQIELRLESDAKAVKLTTIHKSKGLEFEVVYCPFLWNGTLLGSQGRRHPQFHDSDGDLKVDIGSDDLPRHVMVAEREALAENLRLLYVGLTRAKHRCTVVWAAAAQLGSSALAYLAYPPTQELVDSKQLAKRLDEYGDSDHLAVLRDLAQGSSGAIGVRLAELDAQVSEYAPNSDAASVLSARQLHQPITGWWRTTSFTALTRAAHQTRTPLLPRPERDCDAVAIVETPASTLAPGPAITLLDFPRGAVAGTCYHDLLEHIDFCATPKAWEPQVATTLKQHGFPPQLADVLGRSVDEVLHTPLGGQVGSFSLASLVLHKRVNEMAFHLPLSEEAGSTLNAATLANAFRDFPSAAVSRTYAEHAAKLHVEQLRGFLKGYIDLVFEHDGRFFVVDYKTNFLGPNRSDYARPQMEDALQEAHYYLQYHLYCVALHRLLRQRVAGYDYNRHFGGVYYLFVRGMHPDNEQPLGVHFEKPPQARIEALDLLFYSPKVAVP